jgi:ribosomal protein L19E
MANSLKSKLSKLRHDRNISENMYHELLNKIDGHDRELRNKVIDEFVEKVGNYRTYDDYGNVVDILEIAEQIKGG